MECAGASNGAVATGAPPRSSSDHRKLENDDEKLRVITAIQREAVKHCQLAVTTRGSLGCVAMDPTQQCCELAVHMSALKDTTGAGDLFGAGFLYGQLSKCSLQGCCKTGCIVGAAATQVRGLLNQSTQISCTSTVCPEMIWQSCSFVDCARHVESLEFLYHLKRVTCWMVLGARQENCTDVECLQVEGAFLTPEMWTWVHDSIQADPSLRMHAPTA